MQQRRPSLVLLKCNMYHTHILCVTGDRSAFSCMAKMKITEIENKQLSKKKHIIY